MTYSVPLLIGENDVTRLERVPLSLDASTYDEAFIQRLAFEHPECLPIHEVDSVYAELIPVCIELNTPVGPIDALYVTPSGRVVLLEAKLWRNPEARRKVVGQILDYAKELAAWRYEDLDREVARRTSRTLFEIVRSTRADTDEAHFVDEVSKSLSNGRFLLLIVGDGIREGVGAIADFLETVGRLEFTFGLIELALYRGIDTRLLVQPRVLAKTLIVERRIVEVRGAGEIVDVPAQEEDDSDEEYTELQRFYLSFWNEFLGELELDDKGQPIPRPNKVGNVFFSMPPSGGSTWVTVFFEQNRSTVGLFLTFTRGEYANLVFERLQEERVDIDAEFDTPPAWESDGEKHKISLRKTFPNLRAPENREEIKSFLQRSINEYVNVFRPRLARIAESLG